ncbi:MAG: HAMP domain-containing sensor histidine kinase, partial [Bacilli bacterium]
GVQNKEAGMKIIENQVDKLELKVHSLLYLNKINYIKDSNCYHKERVDIVPIIESSVEKFKVQKKNIKWTVNVSDKKRVFNGTYDMWEAIIDNILNNFMRYALTEIKVTVKNNKVIFYNDGPTIDDNILDDIFTPYKKGIKGQFGLGLSIVKKTVALLDYEVSVKNEKKGVSFTIK